MTSKEALEVLNNPLKKEHWDLQNEAYNLLTDLVEKDTPLKTNDNLMKGYYHCSKCGREIPECVNKYFMRYCPNCGQKLLW